MNLNQKQKHGNVISVNLGFAKNTYKTLVLFKESIIDNQGKLDNKNIDKNIFHSSTRF